MDIELLNGEKELMPSFNFDGMYKRNKKATSGPLRFPFHRSMRGENVSNPLLNSGDYDDAFDRLVFSTYLIRLYSRYEHFFPGFRMRLTIAAFAVILAANSQLNLTICWYVVRWFYQMIIFLICHHLPKKSRVPRTIYF